MINETSVTKSLYKLFLGLVKVIPNLLAVLKIITLILNYYKLPTFLFTCVGGTSIIHLILLYLISFIFRFCGIYRLSLNYVSLITALSIFDWYIGIPVNIKTLWRIYTIITGAFITSWIIIWYKNRNNPKIDHIKQLCDKYADCGC